jgi:hypothetical protein
VSVFIDVIVKYIKALHNEKWVKFLIFTDQKDKTIVGNEESKGEKSLEELHKSIGLSFNSSNETLDRLWEMFDQTYAKNQDIKVVFKDVSPVIILMLVKNLTQMDDGYNKNKVAVVKMINLAKTIYFYINAENGCANKERYSASIYSETIEFENQYCIDIITKSSKAFDFQTDYSKYDDSLNEGMTAALFPIEIPEDTGSLDPVNASLVTIKQNIEFLELYTKMQATNSKTYILGKFYQSICNVAIQTKIPSYLKFCQDKILQSYSKVILNLDQSQ